MSTATFHHVNAVANRLSLRKPQRESLEILDHICDVLALQKGTDPAEALRIIQSEFASVTDFERDFPSLCFALATGVGKTRLMGAFISYLYLARGIRHYFVLAPNLTIYNKLIADFTPNTPKYVFQGIAEFAANPPEIITGDNYENGRGIRDEARLQPRLAGIAEIGDVHVNIFNISKINTEVRGGTTPRIKRLSEYIGQSYFDYLSQLDDLVLLMDESHRYRATAGVRAINELKPILGLELTATPQVERSGHSEPFRNVIYNYPLPTAMRDGFVKEPAVATRENFNANNYTAGELERLKLEDGVRVHEHTKVQLEVYARESGQPRVKPFMLVVAQDTGHANALQRLIEDDNFFEGRYKPQVVNGVSFPKVITVHSKQGSEEKDEVVAQLLSVEHIDNPVEIVIHVNMLKEGWDVTNLYTIVPLRAANSRTLVEQSIGRGLRLPYGKRTGAVDVDRLTIVSHDKFQEIIDEANRPDSIIRAGVIIGRDIPLQRSEVMEVRPVLESQLFGMPTQAASPLPIGAVMATDGIATAATGNSILPLSTLTSAGPLFVQPEEQAVARATLQVIQQYQHLPRSAQLANEAVQREIVAQVTEAIEQSIPAQTTLYANAGSKVNIASVVERTTERYVALSIDIPRITVVPSGEVTSGFDDFDLDTSSVHLQPVEQEILIEHLNDHQRYRLMGKDGTPEEERLEDYLVRGLMDFNDINYDAHADLLYKLAGQMVARLRSYLRDDEIRNVLRNHNQTLVDLIHAQMQAHRYERATSYEVKISHGFTTLRTSSYTATAGAQPRNFRQPVEERQLIRGMLFSGFTYCLYPVQKFQSDPERRFAVLLENEGARGTVLKWFKPASGDFKIYLQDGEAYEPDFVVETPTQKLICEPKNRDEMTDGRVRAKAEAAIVWCQHATQHEQNYGGKTWAYLLIPDNAITGNATLQAMIAGYALSSSAS
jgi:type III restriction enzyme